MKYPAHDPQYVDPYNEDPTPPPPGPGPGPDPRLAHLEQMLLMHPEVSKGGEQFNIPSGMGAQDYIDSIIQRYLPR